MKGGMGNLFKQAQQMQQKMAKLQDELGQRTVEASVGAAWSPLPLTARTRF